MYLYVRCYVKIIFKKFWKQLIDKCMVEQKICTLISHNTVGKIRGNENITTEMVVIVYKLLNSNIFEVLQLEKIYGGKGYAEYGC